MLIPSWLKMNLGSRFSEPPSWKTSITQLDKHGCKDPNVRQAPSLSGQGRLCAFPDFPACQLAD